MKDYHEKVTKITDQGKYEYDKKIDDELLWEVPVLDTP